MFSGLDLNFIAASESAGSDELREANAHAADLDRRFRATRLQQSGAGGSDRRGIVLTNIHESVKLLQIDLVGDERTQTFSCVTIVPGLRVDYQQEGAQQRSLLASKNVVDLTDDASFRRLSERRLAASPTRMDRSRVIRSISMSAASTTLLLL